MLFRSRFIEQCKLETKPNDRHGQAALAATETLVSLGRLLGLFLEPPPKAKAGDAWIEKIMQLHVDVRAECRQARNFELADMIRDRLADVGIALEDKPGGTGWSMESSTDENLLDSLIQIHLDVREAARKAKSFELADKVRVKLSAAGVKLEDKPSGTIWHL